MGLLYFGPYLPTSLTVIVFLAVASMAMTTHADSVKVVLVAAASFVLSMMIFWFKGWKSLSGDLMTVRQAAEESLVIMVLVTLIYGTASWIKRLLKTRDAKLDKLLEAAMLYVWIGGTFAFLYTFLEHLNHQAFRHVQVPVGGSQALTFNEWENDIQQMLYYSFVTQTTLGFGDILPVSHLARVLTITQSVIGQFYVAVVLAYILSLWIQDLRVPLNKDIAQPDSSENHNR